MTPAAFKRTIRDLQVWCSSCMVAFSGPDPIGVLIGAKRPYGTLVHKIAVHPDHRRQGHARHLLTSLGSKLAILGPPRIVAEVPDTFGPALALFSASGYVEEAVLTDYVLQWEDGLGRAGLMVARSLTGSSFPSLLTIWPQMISLELPIRRCAGNARSRRSLPGRTTSPAWPSPPTSESRPTSSI